jgi:hypothetical protein
MMMAGTARICEVAGRDKLCGKHCPLMRYRSGFNWIFK